MRLADMVRNGPTLAEPKPKRRRAADSVPIGHRKCTDCGAVRPLADFRLSPKSADGRIKKCPDCDAATVRRVRPVHGMIPDPFRPGIHKTICGARGEFLATSFDRGAMTCELCRTRVAQYAAAAGSENVPD